MGQAVCCLRASTTQQQPRNVRSNSKKTSNRREDKRMLLKVDKSMTTLEECLKNSPAVNPRVQPRKRVYPSTSSPDLGNTPFYTPRMSFSSSSGKMEKVDEAQPCRSSGRCRGKSNKKVTFRLPVEDDIILFYSPKQTFDCIES